MTIVTPTRRCPRADSPVGAERGIASAISQECVTGGGLLNYFRNRAYGRLDSLTPYRNEGMSEPTTPTTPTDNCGTAVSCGRGQIFHPDQPRPRNDPPETDRLLMEKDRHTVTIDLNPHEVRTLERLDRERQTAEAAASLRAERAGPPSPRPTSARGILSMHSDDGVRPQPRQERVRRPDEPGWPKVLHLASSRPDPAPEPAPPAVSPIGDIQVAFPKPPPKVPTLQAKALKATVVLAPAEVLGIPAKDGQARTLLKIAVGGLHSITVDIATKSIRKAKAAITEHGVDGCSAIVQGKLLSAEVLGDAGLVIQPKSPLKANDKEPNNG